MTDVSLKDGLGGWADPLATVSIIAATWLYLWRQGWIPVWQASPWVERARIESLVTALTIERVKEILGREPVTIRRWTAGPHNPKIRSLFFVLRRTYVEAFVDEQDRIYGYTIRARRPSFMGAIDLGAVRVRFGTTTLASAWVSFGPSLATQIYTRSQSYAEASAPWGASVFRTWAVGAVGYGGWGKGSIVERAITRLRREDRGGFESVVDLVQGLHEIGTVFDLESAPEGESRQLEMWVEVDKDALKRFRHAREKVTVNTVSVALQGPTYPLMLSLHSEELFVIDPPRGRRLARLKRHERRGERQWGKRLTHRFW